MSCGVRARVWFLPLVAVCVAVSACRSEVPGPAASATGHRLAQPVPIEPFEAVDLDGRNVALTAWKGQVIIINVWATWCGPCRREMPGLAAIEARHRGRVQVLGVLQDGVTTEFAKAFLGSAGIGYPVIRSTFEIERRFPRILALPTTFVLDPDGGLAAMYAGAVNVAALEAEVIDMLTPKNAVKTR